MSTKSATLKSPTKSPRKVAAPVPAPVEESMVDVSNQDASLEASEASEAPAVVAPVKAVKKAPTKKAAAAAAAAAVATPAQTSESSDNAAPDTKSRRRKNKRPYKRAIDVCWKNAQHDDDDNPPTIEVEEAGKTVTKVAYLSKSAEATDALNDVISAIARQLRAEEQDGRVRMGRNTVKISDCEAATRLIMGVHEGSTAVIEAARNTVSEFDELRAKKKEAASAKAAKSTKSSAAKVTKKTTA